MLLSKRGRRVLSTACAFVAVIYTTNALAQFEQDKMFAADGATGALFGASVSISGSGVRIPGGAVAWHRAVPRYSRMLGHFTGVAQPLAQPLQNILGGCASQQASVVSIHVPVNNRQHAFMVEHTLPTVFPLQSVVHEVSSP